jgi:hypothetical protein
MKNRYIPYGYRIRDGRLSTHDMEAEAVKEVFRLYTGGQSYIAIAIIMNGREYPKHNDNGWNKHHIKRILENSKYAGEFDYPAILSKEQFEAARAVHDDKAVSNAPQGASSDILWQRLRCGECGGRLLRNGSPSIAKGVIRLRCENNDCGYGINIPMAELDSVLLALFSTLISETRRYSCGIYERTPESIRLENEIRRSIDNPGDPDVTTKMILEGITTRYGGIKEPPRLPPEIQYGHESRLLPVPFRVEMDWNLFKEAVSYITIAHEGIGLTTISGYEIFMESEVEKECGVS